MLEKSLIEWLRKRKNLLAFSGGGDSSALFFLLQQNDIPFDIAIVDYGVRKQSKEEVAYAHKLAKTYNLRCYLKETKKIEKNFEANARAIRYRFFESLIDKYGYDTLLTAHHLGDRLEWFLMQFCKGAGCVELGGMEQIQQRKNYTLVRPLLDVTKEEIRHYLHANSIHYFKDDTNDDTTYKRNYFRHTFATPLLKHYAEGIKRSFRYLDEDRADLLGECDVEEIEGCVICKSKTKRALAACIDKELKKKGLVLGRSEKEWLKKGQNGVVGRRFVVAFYKGAAVFCPFVKTKTVLPKNFKEECRLLCIEPKLRPYLCNHPKVFNALKHLTPTAS